MRLKICENLRTASLNPQFTHLEFTHTQLKKKSVLE